MRLEKFAESARKIYDEDGKCKYSVIEHNQGFHGVRLSLTMLEESQDKERIKAMSRRPSRDDEDDGERFLVTFTVNKVLTLVGGDEVTV